MGVDVSNAGVSPHTSNGSTAFHMWAGKEVTGGTDQHRSLAFTSAAHAKQFCAAAAVSKAQARATLTTAQKSWFDALPVAFQDDLVSDGASWHAAGYKW